MSSEQVRQFAKYIKGQRESQKLSLRELEAKTGIHNGTLSRLEQGKIATPKPATLKALALALNVPLADMFAMVGYTTAYDLPSMAPYLRARYGHLPDEKLASVNTYLERLIDEYGLDPNGPLALEDETNEPAPH